MPLIIIPTPVGNLEDMTLRGLRELREADVVACEDTRHTLQLLNHFEIKKPLISCHEHNETERVEPLMARLAAGERVALVSDAGTPGLSDPGGIMARAAAERGPQPIALWKRRKEGRISKEGECKVEGKCIFGRYSGLILFNFQ